MRYGIRYVFLSGMLDDGSFLGSTFIHFIFKNNLSDDFLFYFIFFGENLLLFFCVENV